MRLWYLSHRRPAKAQARLRGCAVSPEPSLFAHMKCVSRRRVRPKSDIYPPYVAARARLKKMSLRRTKSTKLSSDGSILFRSLDKSMSS